MASRSRRYRCDSRSRWMGERQTLLRPRIKSEGMIQPRSVVCEPQAYKSVQRRTLTERIGDEVLKLEVRPCDRRPMGIKRQDREIIAKHQAQDDFCNDATTDGPELRGADRSWRAGDRDRYGYFVYRGFGEHVGPKRAVPGEHAVGDRVNRDRLLSCVRRVDGLADQDLRVVQRRDLHRFGHRLP